MIWANWPKSNWPKSNWPKSNWPNSNWPNLGKGPSRINTDWPKSNWPKSSILGRGGGHETRGRPHRQ